MRSTFLHIWKIPMLLGALTLFGLLAALLGTEFWHVASWLTLSVPLVVGLWCLIKVAVMERLQ
ncbi:hypothetical protein KK062_24680 [Fulvivirgaceae bacterium PWU5]|uniref:Uncharacterized protein n=1 Tax=Dawidia cretensis TaxID=2782350 RepID=A0AAP2GWU9_9BACT|nr:hypothetical protein [Dawidia cretensis]MBT1711462.1 hypothetical protein [Dawidia cretensis]